MTLPNLQKVQADHCTFSEDDIVIVLQDVEMEGELVRTDPRLSIVERNSEMVGAYDRHK